MLNLYRVSTLFACAAVFLGAGVTGVQAGDLASRCGVHDEESKPGQALCGSRENKEQSPARLAFVPVESDKRYRLLITASPQVFLRIKRSTQDSLTHQFPSLDINAFELDAGRELQGSRIEVVGLRGATFPCEDHSQRVSITVVDEDGVVAGNPIEMRLTAPLNGTVAFYVSMNFVPAPPAQDAP